MPPGSSEPAALRSVITVEGMSCTEAVFSTAKVTISREGFPLRERFCSAMAFMALRPGGVAALPRPRILAEIFMQTYFSASLPFSSSGIMTLSSGRITRVSRSVSPDCSAIAMMPLHITMPPATVNISSAVPIPLFSMADETSALFPEATPHTAARSRRAALVERKIGLPDFDRFCNVEDGADLGNRFDDGFDDGFDDDFSDDFGGGSADDPDDGRNKGFDEPTDEEFHDGTVFFDDSVRVSDQSGGEAESDWRSGPRAGREKADLKDAFAALFRSIADRFTGKGKHVRATGLDGSDASFASEFDSAVDEGFAAPPSDPDYPPDAYGEPFPEAGGTPDAPFRDEVAEEYRLPPQEERQQPCYDGEYAQAPFSAAPQESYDLLPDDGDFMPEQGREAWDNAPDEGEIESPDGVEEALPPDGSAGGVFAALADALRKFCRRLPSFRPKVYVPPEPDYHPEDDGIGTPSLASDITRLLEEQNKPGETEQEYDRMRQYISTVSTDTRIRPGDIRQPDNIEEVRAAEDELYSLIASISDTNEQQRRKIGVYEKPPEEDPYNYRGINDDRQYFTDMEAYSFNMNSRYGFESEEKVDPRRQQIETEYSRVYNRAVSQLHIIHGVVGNLV